MKYVLKLLLLPLLGLERGDGVSDVLMGQVSDQSYETFGVSL